MKKHILLAIFILLEIFFLHAQEINQKWLDEINLGKKLYKSGSFDGALKHFQKAASIVPFDTTAFVYIADCGLKSGMSDQVKFGIEKLKLLKYNKPFIYEVQAASFRCIDKDYKSAFKIINEGLSVFPGNLPLLYEEILANYEKGNYATALDKAEKFYTLYPKQLDAAKLILDLVTTKVPDKEKAISYFTLIRSNFPYDLDLLKLEIDYYLKTGNIDLAKKQIEQMIAISPNDANLYYNLALIYFHSSDNEKSIELCQKAIQIDPNFADAHFNVGIFYFLMGVEYNKALSQMNPFQFVNQGKEFISKARDFFENAKPHLKKVIELKPQELDAFEALSTIEILENNLNSLLPQIEAASTLKPEIKQESNTGTPSLFINKLRFEYSNNMFGTLRKGDKGWIKFELNNAGNANATGLTALVNEPIKLPGISYNPIINIDSLAAGQTKEIAIEINYEANNPDIRGMKKISDVPNKLRVLIKEPNGHNSDMVEIAFVLDSDVGASGAEDFWETSTIDFYPEPIPANYLFIIGINNYLYWPKLNNAVKDAQDLRDLLTSRYEFSMKNTYELYNEKATYDNIRNELIKIKNDMTPLDNLLIYYAGHGDYDEKMESGSWVPVNARDTVKTDFIQTVIIKDFLEKIKAKHIILIADACFSGSLFVSKKVEYTERDDQTPSRWALSSGNIEVVADGATGSNSPFAQTLIKVLSDSRKSIAISELIGAVKTGVKNITEQTPIGRPLKMEANKGGDFVFYLKM
jgi:tetratricopeptide (TPR) repeat protein